MILIVDNFDSFTWNLTDYIEQTGEEILLVRNTVCPEDSFSEKIKGVVLSPGPGKPEDAGFLLNYVRYYEKRKPVLGICLGHQAIAQLYGSAIGKAPHPSHGKISEIHLDTSHYLFTGLPQKINVVRYHSLIAEKLPDNLRIICQTENLIMGVSHTEYPVCGIQFHPEAYLTDYGQTIIQNWISFVNR